MKVLKTAIILMNIVIVTLFNTVTIIPTKSTLSSALTTTMAEYFDTKTQTLYSGDVPIDVFVSYTYSKDNYNIKTITSISSVSASIHGSQYAGSVSEYHSLYGNTINVTVYGSAHLTNDYSNITNVYRTFTFNIS